MTIAATPPVEPEAAAPKPIRRSTARVLAVDDGRALLFARPARIRDVGDWYFHTPGGAVEPGEAAVEAAARELLEETGLRAGPAALGAPVATAYSLQRRIDTGAFVAADDTFFLLHANAEATAFPGGHGDRHAWLDPDAMEAASARILPRGLPALLRRLLAEGPPASPIHIRW
ncbi:NUDIX domain-containing protein [Glycomyces sp. A-F 0318]|uniref:NUDIX domain-containing protein n=1 Tax=Glycomyces amatae TaxID=2881355 RepID=UPI001E458BCE|nr:NUDIX domain-containing protein [Glycomyces amatae]MCD0447325.1 NUDIX domain-containing protein [Glycomyces amatae]